MSDQTAVHEVKLTIPAHADRVDLVRLTLYGIASKMGFSYEDIEDMKVAISEACNNSVLYAYEQEGGKVDVTFTVNHKELGIIIRDQGTGFVEEVKDKEPTAWHDKQLEDLQAGGLGFYLMQALMDEVEVIHLDGGGTEVRMTKNVQAIIEDSE